MHVRQASQFGPFATALLLGLIAFASARAEVVQTPLPPQPSGVPWPTDTWARAAPEGDVDRAAVARAVDALFAPDAAERYGETHAVVIVHRGRIVAERYDREHRCDQPVHTMSIAKMMAAVMTGVLVGDGRLALDARTGLPFWGPADPRAAITLRQVLQMTTGLEWREPDDFFEFAFGRGYDRLAEYVATRPLVHPPGTHYQYSDGTPSLAGEIVRREIGGGRKEVAAFLRGRIFEPVGMRHSEPEFDVRGTWYGSSGMRWSPCDLARFGYLLLRDGTWDGRRVLPPGWVAFMRTPSEASLRVAEPEEEGVGGYGGTTQLFDVQREKGADGRERVRVDAFGHAGFGGSRLRIVPSRDLIVVVVGSRGNADELWNRKRRLVSELGRAFPTVAPGSAATPASSARE